MSILIFQPPPMPINEVERGAAVSASGALASLDDPALLAIMQGVSESMRVNASLLSILHGETQYVVAAHGFATGAYRRKNSFSGHAVAAGEDLFFVPDLLADQRFADNPWVNGSVGRYRFYAAALLRLDGAHAIGAISAIDPVPRSNIDDADRRIMADAVKVVIARLRQLQITSCSI